MTTTMAGRRPGTVGIMQPYFLPFIGYFALIKHVDRFILFDTAQFIRHGWIERNRILKPGDGVQYISVPLERFPQATAIKDVRIRTQEQWREKIFRQLDHYRKRAPFFKETITLLREQVFTDTTPHINKFNQTSLRAICDHIGISTPIDLLSDMDIVLPERSKPGEWALEISLRTGYGRYVNPAGGMEIFDRDAYTRKGVELVFIEHDLPTYSQRRATFEPALSIVDVLMFNDPVAVRQMADQVHFL